MGVAKSPGLLPMWLYNVLAGLKKMSFLEIFSFSRKRKKVIFCSRIVKEIKK